MENSGCLQNDPGSVRFRRNSNTLTILGAGVSIYGFWGIIKLFTQIALGIRIFDEANNMLRGEGLRAGIERFGEFANILFLKLISESEQIKKESGIQTKFDISCSWDSIKQVASSARIEYINNTVYKRLNALYKTDIFTPLQIRDSSILKEIMDKLDPLMLTDVDSDVKGDAFEYFLKASTATKNDLGEYFTP